MTRLERYAPLATGITFAIPTLLAHYPPMSDLPLHEGVIGVMRHLGDPAYFPPDLYQLNLGHPNQLFHLVAVALSFVVGTTWAVKILVGAIQIGILLAGARLADHLGRSRWGALLFAPLALGFTYYWGLVTNLTGFVVFFASLPLFDRASVEPRLRSLPKVLGVLLLLYLAHESVLLIAVGFLGVLAVARPLGWRATALRFLPIAAAALFAIGHFVWSLRYFPKGQLTPPPYFPPLWRKVLDLAGDLFGSHDVITRWLLFALGVLAIASLIASRLRLKEKRPVRAKDGGRVLHLQALLLHYRFEALGFAFLLAAALSPETYNGATLLNQRFVGPAWALFAVTAAPKGAASRLAQVASACVPLGMALLSWPQFADSHQSFKNLDAIIEQIPMNSSVGLAAIDRPPYRTRVWSAGPGPARSVALRGGRAHLGLFHSPISPVQIRPQYRWDELDVRTVLSGSMGMMPSHDLRRFSWVIAESRDPHVRDLLVQALAPDAEFVTRSGEWMLFKSTHAQRPLTSPDDPPRKIGDTVVDRVSYLVRRENHPPPPGENIPIPWQVPSAHKP